MSDEYHFACRIADMKPMSCRNRFHSFPARSSEVARAEKRYSSARASANGRDLVVVMINDAEFYAMDERCYRKAQKFTQKNDSLTADTQTPEVLSIKETSRWK